VFNGGLLNFLWYMLMIYVFFAVLMMFIQAFADIFHRENLTGWGKAAWFFIIIMLPFLGLLIYMIVRPKNTEQDKRDMAQAESVQARLVGGSAVDDIARAHDLLAKGAISQAEFDSIKAKALA
jgi:NADH:ubiquinone oxidoreductase subunit 6 (subunit J)